MTYSPGHSFGPLGPSCPWMTVTVLEGNTLIWVSYDSFGLSYPMSYILSFFCVPRISPSEKVMD